MGTILHSKCAKCGFEKDLFVGGGLADCNFETLLHALPDSGKEKLNEAKENGAKTFSIRRRLCVCQGCGNIYAGAEVNYEINGKKEMLTDFCPQCGSEKRIVMPEKSPGQVPCPSCGEKIEFIMSGHWD